MMLRDLEWLCALAEYQHVTDAAVALGTHQPTVSRALARMEDELGVRLFERQPSGITLTPSGKLALDAARAMTSRWSQLREDLRTLNDPESGTVRLAFLDSQATSLVPRLLREFHEHAPHVRLVLVQEPHHDIVRDLDSGAVELAFTSWHPDGPYGWLPVQQERLVLVLPPRHRLAHRRRIRLDEVASDGLITTPEGFGFRSMVMGLFADAGVTPRLALESADLATIEGLVAAGLGVAVVPEPFAGQSGTVGVRIAAAGARRTIGLLWRNDRQLMPPSRRFRDFVEAAAQTGIHEGR